VIATCNAISPLSAAFHSDGPGNGFDAAGGVGIEIARAETIVEYYYARRNHERPFD
jgi:hypothetical protein